MDLSLEGMFRRISPSNLSSKIELIWKEKILSPFLSYLQLENAMANGSNMGRCGINVDSDPSPSNVKMLTAMADEMLKQKNVESVLFGGKKIADQTNYEKLDWFAGELVLEHQRRSCRIAPTVILRQAAQ